jgi:NAD(P)-dependent dehydrogenase (short-subunit alcohol dehydrogenase family)
MLRRTLAVEEVTAMSRIVIITGGSSGIGKALGAALVARGDDVVLAARTEADLQRAADELSAQGPGKARAAVLDVRNADEVTDLVNDVYDNYGRLDLMINNAGIGVIGFAHEMTSGYWERIYDTNVRGVLHGVLAAYPIMIKQGHGQIANTASLAGLLPSPLQGPYTMTKHAVVGLTLSLRMEAQAHGVRVNLICPGVIETPILDKGGPPGLPATPHVFTDARGLLGHATHSSPYPVVRLAREVLSDMDNDKSIIVRPSSARWLWRLYRFSPRLAEAYGRSYVRWATEHMSAARGPDELIPSTQL